MASAFTQEGRFASGGGGVVGVGVGVGVGDWATGTPFPELPPPPLHVQIAKAISEASRKFLIGR
jgi:hypothetical protein